MCFGAPTRRRVSLVANGHFCRNTDCILISPLGAMRIKMKGCFTYMHECNQTECVTGEPRQENIFFCCCKGSRCNSDHKYIKTTTEATTQGEFRLGIWFRCSFVAHIWICLGRVYPNFVIFPFAYLFIFCLFLLLVFYCIFKLQKGEAFTFPINSLACPSEATFFVLTNSRREVAPIPPFFFIFLFLFCCYRPSNPFWSSMCCNFCPPVHVRWFVFIFIVRYEC